MQPLVTARLRWAGWVLVAAAMQFARPVRAAERADLREDPADSRIRAVAADLNVNGKLFPEAGPDKALKLQVEARFEYAERRLNGAGREAQSLRSVRYYDQARAAIQADNQISNRSLRESQRLIVAQGQLEGTEIFSPSGPLTYNELELLHIPGDTLAILGILPDSTVELDETWKPAAWVLPLLLGVEAIEKGELTCKLELLQPGQARIGFRGEVLGATVGAAAAIQVEGHLIFDREQKLVSRIEIKQTEKRSVGTVSPGLDVVAKVTITRAVMARPTRLTDKEIAGLPVDPNAAMRLLVLDAPAWNVRFFHDRHWHLFHQTAEVALLRLLDQGGFVAQCNIKKLPEAEPGQHASEDQFQSDIQRTLGKNFQQIVHSEKLSLKDGLFVFRVVAVGTVDRKNAKNEPESSPMQWIYYLVANSDGRQLALVFSVDPKQADSLENRDLSIVAGLEFLSPRSKPAPAKAARAK